MKLILEKETGTGDNLTISKVKEVPDKATAIKDKGTGKHYLHYCYHDEPKNGQYRPCKRETI